MGAAARDVEVAKANIEQARQTLQRANIMLGYTVLRAPFARVVLVRQAELGEVMGCGWQTSKDASPFERRLGPVDGSNGWHLDVR